MHNRARGFTLIELMIVVGIVGVLGVLVLYGIRRYLASDSQASAEESARIWASKMGYELQGSPVCVERDTDGDGYVSCTLNVKGQAQPMALDCAARWSGNSGCRIQKPVYNSHY